MRIIIFFSILLYVSSCGVLENNEKHTSAPASNNHSFSTSQMTDQRDGQTYSTIRINSQTWLAENLNYKNEGSYYYENNSRNANFYGRLYTWDAAKNSCPEGWHLPSDEEWKVLEMYLGMPQRIADESDWRGSDQGTQLGTKGSIGFNVMMSGYRNIDGNYHDLGQIATFWTSSEHSKNYAWGRGFEQARSKISRRTFGKTYGFAVRCIRD